VEKVISGSRKLGESGAKLLGSHCHRRGLGGHGSSRKALDSVGSVTAFSFSNMSYWIWNRS
jgi:hypothetical protein